MVVKACADEQGIRYDHVLAVSEKLRQSLVCGPLPLVKQQFVALPLADTNVNLTESYADNIAGLGGNLHYGDVLAE